MSDDIRLSACAAARLSDARSSTAIASLVLAERVEVAAVRRDGDGARAVEAGESADVVARHL